MTLAPGTTFASFRIIEPLGKGGMASVYKAYEASLDRYVAVKVLPAEFLHDPTFAERFSREARVIARLEHPNIIPIYAYGIDEEKRIPWMSMRMIAGGALSGTLRASPQRLPFARSLAILRGVAEALDYAHGKGVVHRDVKPQNILLDEAGRVYLADFGIAKMVEASAGLTQTGMISGTPQYMAPEQATGLTVDSRADIYALGIVAFEMFTGRVPFVADTPVAILMKHVSEPMPLPSVAEVPEGLMRGVLKATAKKPEDRWRTALEFVEGLEAGSQADGVARVAEPVVGPSDETLARPVAPVRGAVAPATAAAPTWAAPPTQAPAPRTHVPSATDAPPGRPPRGGSAGPILLALGGLGLLVVLAGAAGVAWFLLQPGPDPVAQVERPPVTPPPVPTAATPWQEAPVPVPAPPTPFEPSVPEPEPASTPWRPAPPATSPATPRPAPPSTTAEPWTPPPAPPAPPAPHPVEPALTAEVRELVDELQRAGSADQRWKAAVELGNLGAEARGAVPALAAALRDRNDQVRWRAAEALGKIGPAAAPAVPALIDALDRSDMLAQEAAKALGRMGSAARPAVSALATALTRSDVYLKREAAKALVKLGPDAAEAVPTLVEALRDKDRTVRAESCRVLGRIGPGARAAVPALKALSRDPEDLVRVQADEALRRIGS